jgi:uncharacterized protein (DUF1501 family)
MLSRRSFLTTTLRGSTLLSLAPSVPAFLARTARASAPERDARVLVVVQLSGGNDGINTVVPYRDEGYAKHRRALRLPSDRLCKINGDLGLHPALAGAAKLLDDGRLAIVQGVGYPNPTRSHFESMAYWHSGRPGHKGEDDSGWLGRALDGAARPADRSPDSLFVGLQSPAHALRGRHATAAALAHLDDLALAGDLPIRRALSAPAAPADLRGFVSRSLLDACTAADRLKEAGGGRDGGARYPQTGLASRLRLVARLLGAGFGTRVFYTEQEGYDTHYSQLHVHAGLLGELGGALRAFLDDLASRKLAERVVVLVFSEFGRRVAENGSEGTDHGTAAPVLLAGAVRPGLVGTAPSLLDLDGGDLKAGIDFRRVYATILEDWLGIPARPVLGAAFDKLPLFRR